MKKEIFKDVPDYKGLYQVSSCGKVKSLPKKCGGKNNPYLSKETILKNRINSRGYYMNTLTKDGKPKHFNTHQLVAMAFLGHTPCGYNIIIDHIDNNKLNNNVENLQITTNRHNCTKDNKRSSGFVGAYKNGSRWASRIRKDKKVIHLGQFDTPQEASERYYLELNLI